MRRSVERIDGIKKLEFDLNTGRGTVVFDAGKQISPEALWKAIEKSGFTPVEVTSRGKTFKGASE